MNDTTNTQTINYYQDKTCISQMPDWLLGLRYAYTSHAAKTKTRTAMKVSSTTPTMLASVTGVVFLRDKRAIRLCIRDAYWH